VCRVLGPASIVDDSEYTTWNARYMMQHVLCGSAMGS